MSEKVILSQLDIGRILARLAHEIVERNERYEKLVFLGMHTRGLPLAQRLSAIIKYFLKVEVPVGALDITFYRDDLSALEVQPVVSHTDVPTDIAGKRIVLVDDVLFTGRSIRAAMDALIDLGRPRCIQLAVLIDRGHRELPIRADYVGKNIPTSRHEDIEVYLEETDGRDEVTIVNLAKGEPARKGL